MTTERSWPHLLMQFVTPLIAFLGVLLLWDGIVRIFNIHPVILPGPLSVYAAIQEERDTLLKAGAYTGFASMLGLLLSIVVGAIIAVIFSTSAKIRSALYPYVIFLQTVPIVAIAPLLILWSGYNLRSIVLVSLIVSLFPIVSNVTAGLISVDKNLRDLFQLYSASRLQTLWKLRIPAAVPNLVLGARVSSGLAVIGTIVGEFFVGSGSSYPGLGNLMMLWQARSKTASLIGAIAVSTLLGVALFSSVNLISRTLLRRWTYRAGFESDR